ncbi:MAG: EpsG family protein, partial [Clostridia bacterium]|nr:EpsG family protein [Clostridia bacterium]
MSFISTILFPTVFIIMFVAENLLIYENTDTLRERKNNYNIFIGIILFLTAALRHRNTGADTASYYGMYRAIANGSRNLVFFWNDFVKSITSNDYEDMIFWNLNSKLFSYINKSPQIWLAFIALIFFFAAYKIIKKYSDDPVISWAYLLCVFVYTFVLKGLRQSVAMSIVILSVDYIYERKLIRFLLLMALATLFHQSAFVFIIAYPLYKFKLSKIYFAIIGISIFMVRIMPSTIVNLWKYFASESRFSNYLEEKNMQSMSMTGWLVFFAIFVFCYLFKKDTIKNNPKNEFLYTMSMVALVMQSGAGIIAEMFRISNYFNLFNMILVANVSS